VVDEGFDGVFVEREEVKNVVQESKTLSGLKR
jgi:hypothetical protein